MKMSLPAGLRAAAITAATLVSVDIALACSRINYDSGDGRTVVARSMDWMESTRSNLWVFPAGIVRAGAAGKNSMHWTSRYGSVTVSMYDIATVDGVNEKGLVANILYLAGADYGARDATRPGLSLGVWGQYVLDSFATVNEAVEAMKGDGFQVTTKEIVPGVASLGHLSLTDASGDSAIFEYINGKLQIHHGRQYKVMTNEPAFEEQLAIEKYWQPISGVFMPGTERPADRFVRAAYYSSQVPSATTERQAVANALGMMRAVSVPAEPASAKNPNVAPTMWRTVIDTKSLTYYYESVTSPNLVWVDLHKIDLKPGAPVMKLDIASDPMLIGDVSASFKPTTAYVPLATD